MERKPVESSNIKSIGYNPDNQVLEVEFTSGTVYQYDDVPPELYADFESAPSVGRFFHQNIKSVYTGVKR